MSPSAPDAATAAHPHAADAKSAARCPFHVEAPLTTSRRMREECADLHEAAEQGDFARAMVAATLTREQYADFLGQMHAAMLVLDQRLAEARATTPAIEALVDDAQMQAPNLRADLEFLAVQPSSVLPRRGSISLIDAANHWAAANPLGLLGLHYVREGANNGNRYVALKLRKAWAHLWDTARPDGFRHLDPYGIDQRPRWDRFKATLDAQPLTPAQQDTLVHAARDMFKAITAIHEDAASA
ncbi:MAG: biliverdin-producing heme oxygenase [Phycisphaeraceae bacterium]|nr:biliverdin-producing heme oxygenase [Phycisphaeraceae bacterium]